MPVGFASLGHVGTNSFFARLSVSKFAIYTVLGPVDKLVSPEACGGDLYEAEIAC